MKVFILEDDEERIDWFKKNLVCDLTIATDISEKDKFEPPYDILFLDHDLGNEIYVPIDAENTGSTFCLTIIKSILNKDTKIIIHSLNTGGAENMMRILQKSGFTNVKYIPFDSLVQVFKNDIKSIGGHAR
jgi:hypothetical protein